MGESSIGGATPPAGWIMRERCERAIWGEMDAGSYRRGARMRAAQPDHRQAKGRWRWMKISKHVDESVSDWGDPSRFPCSSTPKRAFPYFSQPPSSGNFRLATDGRRNLQRTEPESCPSIEEVDVHCRAGNG